MNKFTLFTAISLLMISCGKYSPAIREALKLSGNNREQLEKVLQHYHLPTDSLKLKAACFLIRNMPGHYTLHNEKIDRIRQIIDKDTNCSYYYKKLYDITLEHFIQEGSDSFREEDVQHITADFLIRHIDASFELAYRQKLFDILPFDLFLEYVLPYRFGHERLDLWRDSLQVIFEKEPTGIFFQDFFKEQPYFKLNKHPSPDNRHVKVVRDLLQQDPFKDCYFGACDDMLERRALGLPIILDGIPFYSNRNGYHYWCSNPPLVSKESTIPNAFDRRTAKVYRQTYTRNPVLVPEKDEFVPELFRNPFLQDVTDLYCHTVDITIKSNTTDHPRHVYLCVFNNQQWKPIAAGEVSHGEAIFKQLAKNIVYLPVYYTSAGKSMPYNYPFILDTKGNIKYLIPDKSNRVTLHLERKNPDQMNTLPYYMKKVNGTIVEGANDKKFTQKDTVFIFKDTGKLHYEAYSLHPNKKYKWFRIEKSYNFIAELYFMDLNNKILRGQTDELQCAVIDENPLTSLLLNKELIIHFDSAVNVNKLICFPKTDGNGVFPGNIYELFYFDADGWHSLGIQEGSRFYVEYGNVPGNALYWLHNLTTGLEERIFTNNGDKVIFW